MSADCPVVCAGIIVVDHVAAPVSRVPHAGELLLTNHCQLHIGGCAANVAIDLSKLGIGAHVAGTVGDDLFGEFAISVLSDYGVETRSVSRASGVPTSQTLVLNVQGEDRRFIHLRGANDFFHAASIPETLLHNARVLYVGGLFLMEGLIPAELAPLFRVARSKGIVTLLDVVTPGPGNYLPGLADLLPETDVFLPNVDEARIMTGKEHPFEQASTFREMGAKSVLITRGELGSLYLSQDEMIDAGSYHIDFVDGTGGGDAFVAGFISGILDECPPIECIERGSALGASCVREMGATSGVFRLPDLAEFMQTRTLPVRERKVMNSPALGTRTH